MTRDSAIFFAAKKISLHQVSTKITCVSVINEHGTPCTATFLPPITVGRIVIYGAMVSTEIEVPTI